MAAPELVIAQFLRDQVIFRRALDEDEALVSTAGTTQDQLDAMTTAAAKAAMTGPPKSSEPQAVLLGDVSRGLKDVGKESEGEKKKRVFSPFCVTPIAHPLSFSANPF